MHIKIAAGQKKGALLVRFEEKGKDGIVERKNTEETLVLVIGKREEMTRRKLILLARRVVREALSKRYAELSLDFKQYNFPHLSIPSADLAELLAVNFVMAEFSFREFLSEPKEGFPNIESLFLTNAGGKEIKAGLARGVIIGEEVNRSRHIATMPGGAMTPDILARHAKVAVKGMPVKVAILDEK
ncbi:MAG: hypothetical protein KBA91_03740, partial [Candidatus Moranbacteria bacterium]|nr:hypothetical protein [Candidatus Moranbacteria bacterium]